MSNSEQESDLNEEPPKSSRFKIPRVQVDRSQIPQLSSNRDLSHSVVCEYDQATFEDSLIKQLESQLRRHEKSYSNKRRKKQPTEEDSDIPNTPNGGKEDLESLYLPLLSDLAGTDKSLATIRHTSLDPRPRQVSPIPSEHSEDDDNTLMRTRKSKLHAAYMEVDDVTDEAYLSRMEMVDNTPGSGGEMLSGGLSVPRSVWSRLLGYQRHGVSWLWSLHRKKMGGILGDEMGLGKTVQVCAFLNALHQSQLVDEVQHTTEGYFKTTHKFTGLGQSIIICPATLLRQWVTEIHEWAPPLRVVMLHSAGDSCLSHSATLKQALKLSSVVIVTSYQMLRILKKQLLQVYWHYAVLDEAHRIRNPDADITQVCKQLRTPHRLALSGCPVQNSLKELWSLVDFVCPGSLGTLPLFLDTLAGPITKGGYVCSTEEQVQVAYKCACVLRDALKPYLLRRIKQEVDGDLKLPEKRERVLFCRPTRLQALLYKRYLKTEEAKKGYRGGTNLFVAICVMRKICNHPDIIVRTRFNQDEKGAGETMISMAVVDMCEYLQEIRSRAIVMPDTDTDGSLSPSPAGCYSLSGKMRVTWELLHAWRPQGHRVLIFSQTRQTLDFLEQMVQSMSCGYLRMDGTTSVAARDKLVNRFNEDSSVFVFLLTTRVGGLGLNLTGANRVIIFDPDWNPSTDHQARERAWRIGQEREVSVFRLVTSGTVEEKMYQRQIFKQYLTNRVLKDPKQRRLFTYSDIHELFTFVDTPNSAETPALIQHDVPPSILSTPLHPTSCSPPFPSQESDPDETDDWVITQDDLDTVDPDHVFKGQEEVNPETENTSTTPQKKKKEKKNERRKKRKRHALISSAEIDGHQITGVDTSAPYQPADTDMDPASQDKALLRELLSRCSVDQTIRHDLLEDSTERECILVRQNALQKAEAAAMTIKLARERLANQPVSVPTWTGQKGGVPLLCAPTRSDESKEGFTNLPGVFSGKEAILEATAAPSSSVLLASIRRRNDPDSSETMDTLDRDAEELTRDLRAFVSFQAKSPGKASTDEILTRFSYLPDSQSALFKAILKQICNFNKITGSGQWRLKPEYS